ncbi:MAG TPA: thioredoxin family protein [Thermoanaerobaculia bacterium]|nr:thioredoxin family protein [Thermoanaerobaculia bacterium]
MSPTRSVVVAAALAAALLAAPARAAELKIGGTAPDFTLPAANDGQPVTLQRLLTTNKGVAVLFIATKCPVSNAYNERMAALAKEYAAKGIAFVGINSNKTEPAAETAEHAKKHGFSFVVVKDPGNKVADAYGAQKTPEVFLLNAAGQLIYHGRIDENQDDAKAVRSPDFKNALDAFLAGKPVPVAETKAFGCTIKRV